MTDQTKKTFYVLAGICIFSLSVYYGHKLWYSGDVKDGSGLPALFVTFGGSALGLSLVFWDKVTKTKNGKLIPILGMIITFILLDQYQRHFRRDRIQTEGQTTFAIVTFRGYVRRGKSGGQEIRYVYSVNGKTYEKYATDEKYIKTNNINTNDTLVINYWSQNPNYHDYKVKKNSR